MAEKLYSYADKQVMDEVGSGGGGGSESGGGVVVIQATGSGIAASYKELLSFVNANKLVLYWSQSAVRSTLFFLTSVTTHNEGEYEAKFFNGNNYEQETFVASDADANMEYGT